MKKSILSIAIISLLGVFIFAACGESVPAETEPSAVLQTEPATEPVVTEPPTTEATVPGLSLNHDRIVLITQGETFDIYNGSIDPEQITWSTDDASVATVEKGIVTAIAKGNTMVYAEYEGERASCEIQCSLRFFDETASEGAAEEDQPDTSDPRAPVKAPPSTPVVQSSFFDDAVFIGDSVTLKLSYYAADSGELGKAQFLVRGSYSVGHASKDSMLLTYQGSEMKIEDAVKATGAKKVFMMLGMNDIALYGIDQTIENWGTVVTRIREKNPNVKIYIQSMSPIWTGGEKGSLNNENMDKYNSRLKAFAQNNNCGFVDIAAYMKDSTGGLATKYCSDSFVHVTDAGAAAWVKVLLAQNY